MGYFMRFIFYFLILLTWNVFAIELVGEEKVSNQDGALKELVIIDTVEGKGREAEAGLLVKVHYTGWLYDPQAKDKRGKKFDSSLDRNDPLEFSLGIGQVIKGWDEGVQGMKIGGKRTIHIPAAMGYGTRGAGDVIPPNSDLMFDVELLGLN
jgi:FKBP-type peptidyl-prolyl cis-trans isomerase FkpA